MHVKKSLVLLGFLTAAGTWLLFPSITHAASRQNSVTLSPAVVTRIVQPGSRNTGEMTIRNEGKTGYGFKVYAAPYSVHGEEYTPVFTPLSGHPDIVSWFHLSFTNGYLNPGSTTPLGYILEVPPNTPPGGYYAAIFAEPHIITQLTPKNQVYVDQRVAELFYLQVAGPVVEKGLVAGWHAPFLQKASVTARLRLENAGSVHYFSNITIIVRDILGRPKYRLSAQKIVLPHTIRRVDITWAHPPRIGLFKIDGVATVNGNDRYLAGQYVLVISSSVRLMALIVGGALVVLAVSLHAILGVVKRRPAHYALIKRKHGPR